MKLASIFLSTVLTMASMLHSACSAADTSDAMTRSVRFHTDTIAPLFTGFDGCFVAYDPASNSFFRVNPNMTGNRMTPCSTFKIFNSLAGLESGAVPDPDHVIKWDGTRHSMMEDWNHDHTLRSAVKYSVVWYFQEVARRIGAERMQAYLHQCGYGNEDISGGITKFWLANSLKISPDEQVDFLRRLYFGQLPFSRSTTDTVKALIVLKQTSLATLSGKTGSDYDNGKWILGWFVGYVVHDNQPLFFATCIKGDGARGSKAREISEKILHDAALL